MTAYRYSGTAVVDNVLRTGVIDSIVSTSDSADCAKADADCAKVDVVKENSPGIVNQVLLMGSLLIQDSKC